MRYESLSNSAREVVREAVSKDGTVFKCHNFDRPTGFEVLKNEIYERWESVSENDRPKGDRTYFLYQAKYYGIELDMLDVSVM